MAKRKKTPTAEIATGKSVPLGDASLLADLRQLIDAARQQTARAVNSTLVMMYWHVGRRIRDDVLGNDRGEYGKQIVATLSRQLREEDGRGFTEKALWRMIQFVEVFPDERIAQTLSAQLSWAHFIELISTSRLCRRCRHN
jgi:hypothetical protein